MPAGYPWASKRWSAPAGEVRWWALAPTRLAVLDGRFGHGVMLPGSPIAMSFLAQFIDARRESVSRAIKELQGAGALTRDADASWLLCGQPARGRSRLKLRVAPRPTTDGARCTATRATGAIPL